MPDIQMRNTLKFVKIAMNKLHRAQPTVAPGTPLYRADGSYSVLGMVLKACGIGRRTLANVDKNGRAKRKDPEGNPFASNYMSRILLAVAPGLTEARCASLARINDSGKADNDFKQAVRVVMKRAGIKVAFVANDEGKIYPRSKAAQGWIRMNRPTVQSSVVNGATDFGTDDSW